MTINFDNPELAVETPTPFETDTLVDSVVVLLCLNVAQRLIGFVRSVLFCRWLAPDQLGLWDMAFSFLLLAAPMAVLAIPGSFGRYLEHYRQRGQLHVFLRRTAGVCAVLLVLAVLGIVLTRRWFSLLIFGSADQTDVVDAAAATLLAVVVFNFLIELLTALRKVRLASVMQLINSAAFAVFGAVLLMGWRCSARSALVAYGAACVLSITWAWRPLRRIWQATPTTAEPMPPRMLWGRIAPYIAWGLLGSVLSNVFAVIDRYMIIHFAKVSTDQAQALVGNYHSSRLVPMLLVSIATMLGAMILPHLSHDWEMGRRDLVASRLRLFFKIFGVALFTTAIAVLLAAPLLFGFAFRNKFQGGESVLPWTLLYCTWFGMSMILQGYLLCAEKARLSSLALAAGLVLNVLMNLVLLPRYGLEGAVLSTTAANALTLGMICWFNHHLGFRLDAGSRLVLVLPMLLSLGRVVATIALALVAIDAVWGGWLLAPEEKRHIADGIGDYAKRFGLGWLVRRR